MKALRRNAAEKRLCEAVARGESERFGLGDRIRAELVERLVIGLSLGSGGPCVVTPVGVHIIGATIDGRVRLDNVAGAGGAPLPALIFENCRLEGGFSGAHGDFGRLCFTGCSFGEPPAGDGGRLVPTVDLSDSAIGGDLSMRGVRPIKARGTLWIRAIGARIDGQVDLSCARLRAPPQPPAQLQSEPMPDALNLSLAEIKGDFRFMTGGRCRGRINFRNARVAGDVWMSGATLVSDGVESLFFQHADVGGMFMLDGRHDRTDGEGAFRKFRSRGSINLRDARVGGSLFIQDVDLAPAKGNDTCLYLFGARISASVHIGGQRGKARLAGRINLGAMEIGQDLYIFDALLGVDEKERLSEEAVYAYAIAARRVLVTDVEPLAEKGQGGWEFEPRTRFLSINLDNGRVDLLAVAGSRLSGSFSARSLTCAGDVFFDARIGARVVLESANIGGSLDISELKLDRKATGLWLKDAHIARALRLKRPLPRGEGPQSQLLEARRTELKCLRGVRLVETLWRYRTQSGRSAVSQVAFLEKRGLLHLLDRGPGNLDGFVQRHGHAVDDSGAAAEYLRLFCAYGQDEQASLWVIAAKEGLPPFVSPHVDEGSDEEETGKWRERIRQKTLRLRGSKAGKGFLVRACLLRGDRLETGSFMVSPSEDRISVEYMAEADQSPRPPAPGDAIGRPLDNVPVTSGQFTYHPEAHRNDDRWATEPILEDAVYEPAAVLPVLEERLVPYLQSGFSMYGLVDLRDLFCDTLDDEGGRFWGRNVQIRMEHFVYRQASWEPDLVDRRKTLGQRWRDWKARFAAEWLWYWVIKRLGLVETLRQSADFWEPWQTRRNWIYQQFETEGELCPSRHRIDQSEYRPQPFEQAIRVARAEGRADFAIHFEILKRRIEWRLFTRRSGQPLLLLGTLAALLWLFASRRPDNLTWVSALGLLAVIIICIPPPRKALGRWDVWLRAAIVAAIVAGTTWYLGTAQWDAPRNFLIAMLVLAVIRYISAISDWIMLWMFGYLRRPVRAIATLIGAFLIGWAGVHVAIEQDMMVVDVEPVASLVGRDVENRRILVGIESASDSAAPVRNVSCAGTVSKALYALDVLIPLIDLRAESRCEVGRATPFEPNKQAAARPDEVDDWVRAVRRWTIESEGFWSVLKALYAIAGWFIVSLSILTFAHINQARNDPV